MKKKNIAAYNNQNVPEFYSKFAQIFTIIFIFPGKQITILDSKLRDEIKRLDKKMLKHCFSNLLDKHCKSAKFKKLPIEF